MAIQLSTRQQNLVESGGALLYISNHYAYQSRPDLNQKMYSPSELESVFVEISFTHRSITL